MARQGNDRRGKKLRQYSGSATGMSKHRSSGPSSKNNRFQRNVDHMLASRSEEARKVQRQQRRPPMYATVAEAMKDRRR